jgi:hypothetical protein
MEFSSERFAKLRLWEQIALGSMALAGAGMILSGCASSESVGVNPSHVKYCTFTAEMVGENELQVITNGEPNASEAQISRAKIFENGSSRHHDVTAIGNTITFHFDFDTEYVHVFGIYGNFEAPRDTDARLHDSIHPPHDAVSYWCVRPGTF